MAPSAFVTIVQLRGSAALSWARVACAALAALMGSGCATTEEAPQSAVTVIDREDVGKVYKTTIDRSVDDLLSMDPTELDVLILSEMAAEF